MNAHYDSATHNANRQPLSVSNRALIQLCGTVAIVLIVVGSVHAQETTKPFPQNRVREFYFRQAEKFLDSDKPIPELLPQFPGLDGGSFGHWGQNPSENSVDQTLNQVNSGNVICSHIKHFGNNSFKGVAVELSPEGAADGDRISVLFDPLRFSFTDAWQGGFVSRGSNRFGVHDGASAVGKRLFDFSSSHWKVNGDLSSMARYLGFHRHGRDVVFVYQIGDAKIYDRMWLKERVLYRSIKPIGTLPPDAELIVANNKACVIEGYIATSTKESSVTVPLTFRTENPNRAEQNSYTLRSSDFVGGSTIHMRTLPLSVSDIAKEPIDLAADILSPDQLASPAKGLWVNSTAETKGIREQRTPRLRLIPSQSLMPTPSVWYSNANRRRYCIAFIMAGAQRKRCNGTTRVFNCGFHADR